MIFVYLDVIRIKIFDIDYVIEKVARTSLYIGFSYFTQLSTNLIISRELQIHTSYNTGQ